LLNTLNEFKLNLTIINLSQNNLDDDCMESLGELVQNNQFIENFDIGSNKITDKGIEMLFPYLIGNTMLKFLSISNNIGITDKSVPLLKEIIQKSNITSIEIYGTYITYKCKNEINQILLMPIDQREVPLITIGNVKSASKKSQ